MLFGLETRRPQTAFPRNPDGRDRHADLGVLDSLRQFLDADARRLRRQCRWAIRLPPIGLKVIFNPSFPYRLVHMVLAAYLTTALVVGAVGAFHLLRDSHLAGPRVDVFDGDVDGDPGRADPDSCWRPARPQHAGTSAGEDHGDGRPFESYRDGAPLILFGLPDEQAAKVKYALEIPKLGSLILKHSPDAPLAGLDTVPREKLAAGAYHVLVVPHHGRPGLLMFALGLSSLWARWRGSLFDWRLLHLFAVAMGPAGFVAVLAGWITTETGASRSRSTGCCARLTRRHR